MNNSIFSVLQRIGRAFMLPIALLPIAGLFLGVGASFTNDAMINAYHLSGVIGKGTFIYGILNVIKSAGVVIFDNLPIIFAIGVSIGMAKSEKAAAALAGAVSFFVMHSSISAMLTAFGTKAMDGATCSVLGITSLQMGVFGGILAGLGTAWLHNRFYKIELPQMFSFFGGTRFVPIISSICFLVVGIVMFYVWPVIQSGIHALGGLVLNSGYAGTFIYGVIERALIPFGLHHVFYLPFWQTGVGGTMVIDGEVVKGAQNIFFQHLASPSTVRFDVNSTRFMTGKFPFMMFGLPGAALAMYVCAKEENKKVVGGLLFSAALTSFVTGITEPIEFTFLFVAPVLYVIHCILAGLSFMLMHIFEVCVGMTFSGGFIDFLLFGIMQGHDKTNWMGMLPVGLAYFAVYFFLFRFLINKMGLKTPGREDEGEEVRLYGKADIEIKNNEKVSGISDLRSKNILKGLGGKSNIEYLDSCATRLRVTVLDSSKADRELLKRTGASGVIINGKGVQVIYGPEVTVIKSKLEEYMEGLSDSDSEEEPEHNEETDEKPATPSDSVKDAGEDTVFMPLNGEIIPLEKVSDEAFSQGMMGKGFAVIPSEGKVFAPFDGTAETVFETKHAYGLVSEKGLELLIHIGIDTVKLEGKHFDAKIKDGDKIRKGDLIAEFDIDEIRKAGFSLETPVIVTNGLEDAEPEIMKTGVAEAKEPVMRAGF